MEDIELERGETLEDFVSWYPISRYPFELSSFILPSIATTNIVNLLPVYKVNKVLIRPEDSARPKSDDQ